jgi:serine/threonine-protein kinase
MLHRDVKPANILLTHPEDDERRILLADFGVARQLADISGITETNVAVGTVAYAAPEQLVGGNIDGRADQYALAASAFHLLTGAPPYRHSNPVAVIGQHLHAAPPRLSDQRPDLARLDDVFFKALAKDPSTDSIGAGTLPLPSTTRSPAAVLSCVAAPPRRNAAADFRSRPASPPRPPSRWSSR